MAAAYAAKYAKVDVIAAYPITPQTTAIEYLSQWVASGELDAEFVPAESEHSAMTICIAASASGARTFTATASQGLALMHEMLYIASGLRTPVVMMIGNRSLSSPLSIWNDHQDSMAERDAGWIQMYAENVQETFDMGLMCYRVGEDSRVMLPAMFCIDGFFLTHTYQNVVLPDQEQVDEFLPPYSPKYRLDPSNPIAMGTVGDPRWYMEFARQKVEAMEAAKGVVEEAHREFEKIFERRYEPFIERFHCDDADYIFITMGSVSGTFRHMVRELRKEGASVGLVRVRTFRPFPYEELREAISGAKVVGIVDRSISFGAMKSCGPLFLEVRAALCEQEKKPKTVNLILGIGGRDTTPSMVRDCFKKIQSMDERAGFDIFWIGLRE